MRTHKKPLIMFTRDNDQHWEAGVDDDGAIRVHVPFYGFVVLAVVAALVVATFCW